LTIDELVEIETIYSGSIFLNATDIVKVTQTKIPFVPVLNDVPDAETNCIENMSFGMMFGYNMEFVHYKKIDRNLLLGIGVGAIFRVENDNYSFNKGESYHFLFCPVFGSIRYGNTQKFSPYFQLNIGTFPGYSLVVFNPSIGISIPVSKSNAIDLGLGFSKVSEFSKGLIGNSAASGQIKLGFSFW